MKALCFIGLHNWGHAVQSWHGVIRLQFSACGYERLNKICARCGEVKEIEWDALKDKKLPLIVDDM